MFQKFLIKIALHAVRDAKPPRKVETYMGLPLTAQNLPAIIGYYAYNHGVSVDVLPAECRRYWQQAAQYTMEGGSNG